MMIRYRMIDSNILNINGKELIFDNNINNVIEYNNILIVHVFNNNSSTMLEQPVNNIYGVSNTGKIIWNIQEFFNNSNNEMYNLFHDISCVSMYMNQEGELIIVTYDGLAYVLDIENMQIVRRLTTK